MKKRILSLALGILLCSGVFAGVPVSAESYMPYNAPAPESGTIRWMNGGEVRSTYAVYDIPLTWQEAEAFCRFYGGHLATITSATEQRVIEHWMGQVGISRQYWIGAESTSGTMRWVTGEAMTYTNWDLIEPNSQHRADGQREMYAQIYNEANPAVPSSERYKWNDMFYDNTYPGEEDFFCPENVGFICEWDSDGIAEGFDLTKDAWTIRNTAASFSYPDEYRYPIERYYEVFADVKATAFVSVKGYQALFGAGEWNGNCFGLSAAAVLNYAGKLDLEDYFTKDADELNSYGYDFKTDSLYGLRYSSDAVALIERLNISQDSMQCSFAEVIDSGSCKKRFKELVEYLQGDDPTPLVIALTYGFGGHALVTNTATPPIKTTFNGSDDYYAIRVYDPNTPYDGNGLKSPHELYGFALERFLYVNPETGAWYYLFNPLVGKEEWWGDTWNYPTAGMSSLRCYDVTKYSDNFLKKNLTLAPDDGKTYAYILGDGASLTADGKKFVFDTDYYGVQSDFEYIPFFGASLDGENKTFRGKVILDTGKITAESLRNTDIVYFSGGNILSVSTDNGTEYTVDAENNSVTLKSGGGTSFDIAIGNESSDDFNALRLSGTAEGGELTLSLDDDGGVGVAGDLADLRADVTLEGSDLEAVTFGCCDLGEIRDKKLDEITPPDRLRGDINTDDALNIDDALLLFQYSMLPDVYSVDYIGKLDYTGDGEVNIDDALCLFQYSILPDVYPLG